MKPHSAEAITPEESSLLHQLLLLTGREDRKAGHDADQIAAVKAIWPIIQTSFEHGLDAEARCDLLNRLLLALGIRPMSDKFFEIVLADVDFAKTGKFREKVEQFRILCLLEFGNFRYGYKRFNQDDTLITDKWKLHFPDSNEASLRAKKLRTRPQPAGLIPIDPEHLFALGYLASEQAQKINSARATVLGVLESAIASEAKNYSDLDAAAKAIGVMDLLQALARAGLPGTEALVNGPLWSGNKDYTQVLVELKEDCVTVDTTMIDRARELGRQNANTYLAMHDLDVYVATSMRDPLHFTTNWTFVQRLFHQGELSDWHLRYFDPTQAYLPDRIQKGLLECLMIKRAAVTVYNAQEADTFGKDAELGVTLAQRKPAIVYVARLFEKNSAILKIYTVADAAASLHRDELIDRLRALDYITEQDDPALRAPEKTKSDVLGFMLTKTLRPILEKTSASELTSELVKQGYTPPDENPKLGSYVLDRIVALEKRALIFREVHPLSLQTSPFDGVARGVIVTRTVEQTAKVLSGLLRHTVEYEIKDQGENWLLVDRITQSPVRVVSKNPVLTTAFWSEHWGV